MIPIEMLFYAHLARVTDRITPGFKSQYGKRAPNLEKYISNIVLDSGGDALPAGNGKEVANSGRGVFFHSTGQENAAGAGRFAESRGRGFQ